MLAWEKKTDIAIWGIGHYGMKMYYKYRHSYNVKYFIDSYPRKQRINGIPVILPKDIPNIKILIAVEKYTEICRQCDNLGKKFLQDYLPYDFFEYTEIDICRLNEIIGTGDVQGTFDQLLRNQRIAIIVGNCQTEYIQKYMCQSKKFISEYIFVKIPMIHMMDSEREMVLKQNQYIFKKCSLFLTQIISENNGFSKFLSTENICNLLGNTTKVVKIPVLYFDIYFPQTIHQRKEIQELKEVGILSFPYGDCILDDLSTRYSSGEIVEIVKDEQLFSKTFLSNFREYRINQLKEKEKECNVIILDYILENYRKELLFYSKNHPCNKLLIELVRRILELLGINDFEPSLKLCREMDSWQEIIYPSVVKEYGLRFQKNTYKDAALNQECDFEDIVRYYLSYVHDIR